MNKFSEHGIKKEEDCLKQFHEFDFVKAANNMLKYGGGFMKKIGEAVLRADVENRQKLFNAFPEKFQEYANFNN